LGPRGLSGGAIEAIWSLVGDVEWTAGDLARKVLDRHSVEARECRIALEAVIGRPVRTEADVAAAVACIKSGSGFVLVCDEVDGVPIYSIEISNSWAQSRSARVAGKRRSESLGEVRAALARSFKGREFAARDVVDAAAADRELAAALRAATTRGHITTRGAGRVLKRLADDDGAACRRAVDNAHVWRIEA